LRKTAAGLLECDVKSGGIMERHHGPAPLRIRPAVLGILLGALIMACMVLLSAGVEAQSPVKNTGISVEYPSNGSIFPPDMSPPTFLWRDTTQAKIWVIEVDARGARPFLCGSGSAHPAAGIGRSACMEAGISGMGRYQEALGETPGDCDSYRLCR
jgi:hypothetical protein